ncbi:MAG: MgtC/SapB family protein [Pseudomonadota bacterium]
MDPQFLDTGLRLGAATAVGVIIGINRDMKDKPAGMRTLGLVALGAAVITLAAIQYEGMAEHADALSRVIQGVLQGIMTGVGFIGVGAILRDREAQRIEGVTTAASVWMTAALAVACAFAAWRIVLIGLVLALVLLVVLAWIEGRR